MSQASFITNSQNSARISNIYPSRAFDCSLPIVFESRGQENRWFLMFKSMQWMKPMVASLAPHGDTLISLEIKPHLYSLFERAGLDIDRVMNQPTHQSLVYEFLSSFVMIHGDTPCGANSVWKFRIQNTSFEWTREQVTLYLQFPEYGMFPKPTENELNKFWETMTGLKEFGPKASPYSIDTTVWQYAHRLIATNINCQPETVDYVTLEDLELMWAMDEGEPMDWFKIFSIKFMAMQHQYGPQRFVGCTSLITLIAKACGFHFVCTHGEHKDLDWSVWKKSSIIARPIEANPQLTDVTEPSQWDEEVNSWVQEPVEVENNEEAQENPPSEKKQRIEIEEGYAMNDKVDWTKVRRVVVYEF